jgi:hypothetical protein
VLARGLVAGVEVVFRCVRCCRCWVLGVLGVLGVVVAVVVGGSWAVGCSRTLEPNWVHNTFRGWIVEIIHYSTFTRYG